MGDGSIFALIINDVKSDDRFARATQMLNERLRMIEQSRKESREIKKMKIPSVNEIQMNNSN